MTVTYSEKLRDPRWQRLRLKVMERDNFSCIACSDRKSTLNVHHKKYHGEPWDAPLSELETLCETCHKRRGEINKYFLSLDSWTAIALVSHLQAMREVDNSAFNLEDRYFAELRCSEIGWRESLVEDPR